MSDRGRRGLRYVLLLLLLLASRGPARLAAQETTGSLTARLDSIAVLWREADAVARLVDSLSHRPAPVRIDSLRIGGLVILATNTPVHLRAAAESAWKVLDGFYGSGAAELAAHPFRLAGLDSAQLSTAVEGRWGHQVPRDLPLPQLTHFLIFAAPIGDPDPAFHQWLGGVVRPVLEPASGLGEVYTALVTSSFRVAQDCFEGDLEHCRTALSLDEGDSVLLRRYPTAEDRRQLMEQVRTGWSTQAQGKTGVRACLAGDDARCQEELHALPAPRLILPFPPVVRLSLAQLAVQLGGREGYSRLTSSHDLPVAERLATASGLPVDTLLARWRERVIRNRPAPVAVPFGQLTAGLGWILIFGLCGVRSSRWRVG